MVKELYTTATKQITLNIVDTKLESVQKENITKVGYRVYDKGYIGVAGGLGQVDKAMLEAKATAKLALEIPYEELLTCDTSSHRDLREIEFDEVDFIRSTEELLYELRKRYKDMTFSQQIIMEESYISLENTSDLRLSNRDATITVALLARDLQSNEPFDTGIMYTSRTWDKERILQDCQRVLESYKTSVDLPKEGKLPVILEQGLVTVMLEEELSGERMGSEGSLLQDELGKKVFSSKLTFGQCQDSTVYHVPFFDAEGGVNLGYRHHLIEEGVVIGPHTDKKTARLFNYDYTASSMSTYDGVPLNQMPASFLGSSGQTVKELLNGELGILVVVAGSGGYNADGKFVYPVQHAILTDGEKMLGRLPKLKIESDFYKMFGKDYRGYSEDLFYANEQMVVMDLEVSLE